MIYDLLSYELLVWLHYGSDFLIEHLLWFIVLPIITNILLIMSPLFRSNSNSESVEINLDNLNINESYKFAYALSRNPRILGVNAQEEAKRVFIAIDNKLNTLQQLSKLNESETKGTKWKSNSKKGIVHTSLKWFFHTFNIIVLSSIFILNFYFYFEYSSMINTYFNETDKGFAINIEQYREIESEEKKSQILRLSNYLDMVYEIKQTSVKGNINE